METTAEGERIRPRGGRDASGDGDERGAPRRRGLPEAEPALDRELEERADDSRIEPASGVPDQLRERRRDGHPDHQMMYAKRRD